MCARSVRCLFQRNSASDSEALRESRCSSTFAACVLSVQCIQDVVLRACKLALPTCMRRAVDEVLDEQSTLRVPTKGALSFARFTLDVAYMLWWRARHAQHMRDGRRFAHYLSWDSSPQYGRDYELCLCQSIEQAVIPDLFAAWLLSPDSADTAQMIMDAVQVLPHGSGRSRSDLHRMLRLLLGFGVQEK